MLWNPTDDDFEAKPAELFQRGVNFAQAALAGTGAKLFIHCAAGVHRAPMMALAVLGSMGWSLNDAMELIERTASGGGFCRRVCAERGGISGGVRLACRWAAGDSTVRPRQGFPSGKLLRSG